MKVCWFGIYDPQYSRNRILIDGLRENNVQVIECNYRGKGLGKYISLIMALVRLKNRYDYLYCAFPVHVCVVLAFLFQRKSIVVDAFFSKYDSVVYDRKLYPKYYPKALFYLLLDMLMINLSSVVIVDTQEHKRFFTKWRNQRDIFVVPVGVHSNDFYPIKGLDQPQRVNFLVQFHGSYIPLQGVDKIVETALILKEERGILFRLIGGGQEFEKIKLMADDLELHNISFLPWMPIYELNEKLNEADIILGIFGDTKKTDRVIPNKLFQGLAVRKAVITKDTPSVRGLFTEDELVMVPNDPAKIAAAILHLYQNDAVRMKLAQSGYRKVMNEFTEKSLGARLLSSFQGIHIS